MSPCYPSDKNLECTVCVRYRPGYAMPAERRHAIIIDASVVRVAGKECAMWAPVPATQPFNERNDRESLTA